MASMNDKDYYKILGVDSQATSEQIRRAFQKKARTLHPDVNKEPDAEEKFKIVSEAYAVLSDEDKRRRYDAMRSGNPFASAQGTPSNYPQGAPWPFGSSWTSPFGSTQVGRGYAYNPQAGADVVIQVDFDVDTAKSGCKRKITYNHYETCEVCHGAGSVEADVSETCPTCHGTGRLEINLEDLFGFGNISTVCPECNGTGRIVKNPCHACSGTGRKLTSSVIEVEVPAGVHDGETIRIKGKGNAGTNGSSTGDFVVRVGVPAERLEPRQAAGFRLFGFMVPFLSLAVLSGSFIGALFDLAITLCISFFLIFRGGFEKKGLIWWQNGGRAVLGGIANGLVIAIFVFAFQSCVTGMGTAGFMGR